MFNVRDYDTLHECQGAELDKKLAKKLVGETARYERNARAVDKDPLGRTHTKKILDLVAHGSA